MRFNLICLSTLVGGLLCLQAFAAQTQPKPAFLTRKGTEILMNGKPFRAVSVNKWQLAIEYIGLGREPDPDHAVKSIQEAAKCGFNVIRFAANGFYAKDMNKWSLPDYWDKMDGLIKAAKEAGVYLIPTLNWNTYLFPDMAGETVQDMMLNRDSKSRQYLELFIYQMVTRYKDEPTILFWELSNELNLGADLGYMRPYGFSDLNAVDRGSAIWRVRKDNYTSDMMIKYVREISQFIKKLDSNHLIGSGYSTPRPPAQHLRTKNGDWTEDSLEDVTTYIRDTHPDPVDLISFHFYSNVDNMRFGNQDKNSASALKMLKQACDRVGKPVYIGETGGDYGPTLPRNSYTANVLAEAVKDNYPLIMLWVWDVPGDGCDITADKQPELIKLMQFYNKERTGE